MPKVARYIKESLKAQTVDIVYINSDFGKGGHDEFVKAAAALGMKVGVDISTDQGQVDFSAAVVKAKQSNGDVLFVYTNEDEAARLAREACPGQWRWKRIPRGACPEQESRGSKRPEQILCTAGEIGNSLDRGHG